KPRDVGQQRLSGTDVRRRLFTTNVLLARLQRHAVRTIAVRIHRYANDASGCLTDVRLERGKERRMGAAVAERDAESLRVPEHNVRADLSRWREQGKAQ